MKKSKKLLSVLLALVMMFSTVSVALAGTLNVNDRTKAEDLISSNSLATLVGSLLTDINGAKKNVTGTVLRFCFMFIEEESLQKKIGATDVTKASDEALATILLNWLDEQLPTWTSSLTEQSWWGTLTGVLDFLGITLKLNNTDGVLETVVSLCETVGNRTVVKFGILDKLNGAALKNVKRASGDLNVIYALVQWLADNSVVLQEAVKGNLDLGGLVDFVGGIVSGLQDTLDDVSKMLKNIPVFAKSFIYKLVDGNAEEGKLDADKEKAAGDWGKSEFKDFTADELLAAALIRLIRNQDVDSFLADAENVKKDADDAVDNESFYTLLANNLENLFINYKAADWLNENVVKLIKDISVTDEIKKVFKSSVTFTNDTFKPVYASAKTNGVLGAMNDLLCVIAKTILTDTANSTLALTAGANTNLNANLKKLCQFVLPLMANKTVSDNLGYDFTAFTAAAVKSMEVKEMAVAVLKLFFEGWFNGSAKFNKTDVNKAATLEQLGALAVYYTATNAEWLPFDVSVSAPAAGLKGDAATKYILDTGALIGLNALKYNGDKIYFDTTVSSGYENIVDEISDWGLNFIKGLPAVIVAETSAEPARMTLNRGAYDDAVNGGAFYKVNVVLNELIDFAFFTNDKGDKAPTTFKFDLGLFLTDTLLDNIYNFDLEGVFNAFKRNSNAGNLLNQKNVINAVLKLVDRVATALFKHTDGAEASKTVTAETCTLKTTYSFSYDSANGHYTKAAGISKTAQNKHNFSKIIATTTGKNCKTYGTRTTQCSICGETKTENTKVGAHTFTVKVRTVAPTCAAQGYDVYKCSACGKEDAAKHNVKAATGKHTWDNGKVTKAATCKDTGVKTFTCTVCKTTKTETIAKLTTHTYKDGKCTVCGAKDPNYKPAPAYKICDVDNNGKIEAADARLALRGSVGLVDAGVDLANTKSVNFLAADTDKNGKIEASDARTILRVSVGLDTVA